MDTETHNSKLHAHEKAADAAFDRELLDERIEQTVANAAKAAAAELLTEDLPMSAQVSLEDAVTDWWRECGDDVLRHVQQCAQRMEPW